MRRLASVSKKIGYVVAICIIIAALLMSASRLLTPMLNKHHAEFEQYASKLVDAPVTIDKINFSWYGYQPVINLSQVTIYNKETQKPALQIATVRLFVSIPHTLWERTPVMSGIMIAGADIHLHETATGEISVQGFKALGNFKGEPLASETKFKNLAGLLFIQPRLMLRDINVRFTEASGLTRSITLYDLSIQNSIHQHIVLGKAVLHQEIPTEVTLALQLQGDTPDLAQLKAKIYLYISGLSLSQWSKNWTFQGWQIKEGVTSAKIWATWNHNTFQKIQTTLQAYDLNLYAEKDKSTHKIPRLSGNFGWKRQDKGQVFAGDDILIDLPNHLWPVTSFYVSLMPDDKAVLQPKTITVGYVDLDDVKSFLFSSPFHLPQEVQQLITELQLKGALQNASITFLGPMTDINHIAFTTNFTQLSVAAWHAFPAIKNLSGLLNWDGKQGSLSFDTNRAIFNFSNLFPQPINVDQLSGSMHFTHDATSAWLLSITSLQILNSDLGANVSGTLTFPQTGSPVADVKANFAAEKIDHLSHYFPTHIMDAELVAWLKKSLLGGEIKSATMILQGPLADFPFDKNNGHFSVIGQVRNVDLRYAPDWPVLKDISGQLDFTGRKMTVNIDNAKTMDIPITNVTAVIPYLGDAKPQILTVESNNIKTDFVEAIQFVHTSPLEKNIGKMFADAALKGPTTLKLKLTIPLKNPDATQVEGSVSLEDTELSLVPWHLVLNKLNGNVQFTEKSTQAENIHGELFGKPLQLNLSTVQKDKNTSVFRAAFTTNINIAEIEKWLKLPTSSVVQGATDISGTADFSLKLPVEIHLQSNLVGVAVDLPDQYAKPAQTARDFSSTLILQAAKPLRIQLTYGNLVSTALILEHKNDKFDLTAADVRFGTGLAEWPTTPGLYITGHFDKLDFDKIKQYATPPSPTSNNQFAGLKLRGIDITVGALSISGLNLNQARLQVVPLPDFWDIEITSSDIAGQLQVPVNFSKQSVLTATFDRLNFRTALSGQQIASEINVSSLPAIVFDASNVTYNNMAIGRIAFKTQSSPQGLVILGLRITSPHVNLQAGGEWTQTGKTYSTHLQGSAASSNPSSLLNSLGFNAHNFVSSNGRINFNLTWNDAPYAPAVASLSGTVLLDMGKGRIVDVGQGTDAKMDIGRLLSIFSLQTIPRRLTGDFSDLFQKGYSFDTLRGNFKLQNGNAYTTNMRIDGPVAKVGIDGRIGLANKDYDFILSVTPSVTSSIPVAAATLSAVSVINPIVGLAALAVNAVVGPQVSKVITYHYTVIGPWNNPTWKSVGNGKK